MTLQAQDTLRLDAAQALARAVSQAPMLRAAVARESSATALVQQAGAWKNPVFSITAENLGAEVQTTGKSGVAGIEGQAIIEQTFTLGGDRGAAIGQARALAGEAMATRRLVEADLRLLAVEAIARADRDAADAAFASQEALALRQIATMMSRRAAEGRSSGGEAALAAVEAASAASLSARRSALAAESQADLARVLGVAPGMHVIVESAACATMPAPPRDSAPELQRAAFSVAAADAGLARARAARIPDLRPSAGLRRTQGFSGLWLGLALDLPILQSGASAEKAARFQADAVRDEMEALSLAIAARTAGSTAAMRQLDLVAPLFDAELVHDLERAVRSAESRHAAGEGTLVELLDTRRARLALLTEYEEWRAAQRIARARQARWSGTPIDAEMLCDTNGRLRQ